MASKAGLEAAVRTRPLNVSTTAGFRRRATATLPQPRSC